MRLPPMDRRACHERVAVAGGDGRARHAPTWGPASTSDVVAGLGMRDTAGHRCSVGNGLARACYAGRMPAYPTHPQRRNPKRPPANPERHTLVKYLVSAGLGSRRHCAALVMAGYVSVNDEVASSLTLEVSFRDQIEVDGRLVQAKRGSHVYVLANKPDGYMSSVTDDRGRDTVLDLVPRALRMNGLVPAGRLDLHSTGLMLLTTDGELVNRVTHPRYEVEKEYHVALDAVVQPSASSRLRTGVEIEGGTARAKALRRLQDAPGFRYSVTLNEGKKREVRLMLREVGRQVLELTRVRIGNLTLGDLPAGEVRELTDREVSDLKRLVGIYAPREPEGEGRPGPAAVARSRPTAGAPSTAARSGPSTAGRSGRTRAGDGPSTAARSGRAGVGDAPSTAARSGPSAAARSGRTGARDGPSTAARSGSSTASRSGRAGVGDGPSTASRSGRAGTDEPRSDRERPAGDRPARERGRPPGDGPRSGSVPGGRPSSSGAPRSGPQRQRRTGQGGGVRRKDGRSR